ncbi:LytR/AlgR family response regulator transcription factor [Chitinophaga vietnamensis]|uniref:LytR/AlgR family response regulator transcription factor n=1 Tax=Chitinophaga vietnamensis TaxID=2593957 RepID=UPI001177A79A|nr:LytTR family DNA-binding domain-containing protein [Chitinophaga vietnamensis]
MIKCIIVDDEPRNISILTKMLGLYCLDVTITGTASKVSEAITLIGENAPDLLFLDIELPGQDAFDLLSQIAPVSFEVIFVTAYASYATKAFRYNALDYLLKPIDIGDLKQAVQKVRDRHSARHIHTRLNDLLQEVQQTQHSNRIILRTNQGSFFYPVADIVACIAEGAYTLFEFTNKKPLLISGYLKKYEAILPERDFYRVHDAYIINLNHIVKYLPGKNGQVEMSNGKIIEISQRRKHDFMNRLKL